MLGLHRLKHPLIWGLSRPIVSSLLNPLLEERLSIFVLHRLHAPEAGIFGHTPEFLCAMLERLRREGYDLVSLERVIERLTGEDTSPLRKGVIFTMDDGYADQGEMASEIIRKYDCPVTLFLSTGCVDGVLWPWDAKIRHLVFATQASKITLRVCGEPLDLDLGDASSRRQSSRRVIARYRRMRYPECQTLVRELEEQAEIVLPNSPPDAFAPLTWDRVRKLESKGIRFAPHGVTHETLSRLTEPQARAEIASSWERLSAQVTAPLPVFAYPSGVYGRDFGAREIELAKQVGLRAALSTDPGTLATGASEDVEQRWRIPRFSLPENMTEVLQYASWIERANEHVRGRMGRDVQAMQLGPRSNRAADSPLSEEKGRIPRMEYEGLQGIMALKNLRGTLNAYLSNRYGGTRAFLRHYGYQLLDWLGFYRTYKRIRWEKVRRVWFVCKGNICRSPFAEVVARNRGLDAHSCGLDLKEGSPANPTAKRVGSRFRVDLSRHRSQSLAPLTIEEGDLILVMEPGQADQVLAALPTSTGAQVTLLGLWADRPRPYLHDPFGKDDLYFGECFRIIEESVRCIDELIRKHCTSSRSRAQSAEP